MAFPMRIILFGSEGGFSRPVLEKLLQKEVSMLAVVMPGITTQEHPVSGISVPVRQSPDLSSLSGFARTHQIPVIRTADCNNDLLVNRLSELNADIFLLACFPLKLPKTLWQTLGVACWNLHPSLLPKYRGPNPMYWQLKHNERSTGITLHEVTEVMDAGNIVAQKPVPLPKDDSPASLDAWVAENGVDLFIETLRHYRQGNIKTIHQHETDASYFPCPDL